MAKIKIVHYINQFFAGIGGEEKADIPPEIRKGKVGPGMAIEAACKGEAEIVATVICGDTYFNGNIDKAAAEILEMVKQEKPDLFIAGPAFNAGRYGVACGHIAAAVQEELGIPSVTGMYAENPGADMYKDRVYMISTKNSAAGMRDAAPKMASLSMKLAKGEPIGPSVVEGYLPNGIRVNFFEKERGSKRAVNMLLSKLSGKSYTTEYPMPAFDRVDPVPGIKDLSKARIALVTSGGIVPKGNPDHIESSSASHYGEYSLEGVADLTAETYETAHGGYDPVYANADADRVLPVDVLRDLEKEGVIGSLHQFYYATVGNGTAVASAKAAVCQGGRGHSDQHLRNLYTLRCNNGERNRTRRSSRRAHLHDYADLQDGRSKSHRSGSSDSSSFWQSVSSARRGKGPSPFDCGKGTESPVHGY